MQFSTAEIGDRRRSPSFGEHLSKEVKQELAEMRVFQNEPGVKVSISKET